MTRLIVALLLVFGLTTLASAGDHCFVQPYNAVVVQNGNVLLDVPPDILERIAPVQAKPLGK